MRILSLILILSFSNSFAGMSTDDINEIYKQSKAKASNVMIGDSITYLGLWPDLLKNTNILNRGVPGDTSRQILQRMDYIVSVNPKRAFLMLGINDAYRDNIKAQETIENYIKIIDILLKNNIEVIITSTLCCNKSISQQCLNAETKIFEINQNIKKFAEYHNIRFIDLNSKLCSKEGLDKKFTQDGVHINIFAYKIWAELIKPYI